MHSEEQDYPLSKMIITIEGEFKFGMETLDTIIKDAIKESAEYKYYKIKKDEKSYSDATRNYSWSDTDNEDTKDSNMDISDDDFKKGDDDAAAFRVFMYNKSKELPKFTPFCPTVTCLSLEDFTNLLNDPSK
nr:hypothetical protein [Tanacetum cinerariifolium]